MQSFFGRFSTALLELTMIASIKFFWVILSYKDKLRPCKDPLKTTWYKSANISSGVYTFFFPFIASA